MWFPRTSFIMCVLLFYTCECPASMRKCFICDGRRDEACNNPLIMRKDYLDQGCNGTQCHILTLTVDEKPYQVRGCGVADCEHYGGSSVCSLVYCGDDLCNQASRLRVPPWTLWIPLGLSLLALYVNQ